MSYRWVEDPFVVPDGVCRLDLPEPGKKYVMYHGTTRQAAQSIQATGFRQAADGMLGPGVYFSRDLEKARRYPIDQPESDKVVIKVLVDVGRVIAINRQGHPRQKTWHDPRYGEVYDTAWVPPNCGMVSSGLEEDCVWDPKRIKIIKVIYPRCVQQQELSGGQASTAAGSNVQCAEDEGAGPLVLPDLISGKTYAMYHGTTSQAARSIMTTGFRRSAGGMLGPGVYLSRDLEKASRYPIKHPEHDRVVIKVVAKVGEVIVIDCQGHPRQKTWQDPRYGEVYDTAWVPPNCGMVKSSLEENCVWDPNRIKIIKTITPRLI